MSLRVSRYLRDFAAPTWRCGRLRTFLVLLLWLSATGATPAFARRKGPPEDLPGHVAYIAKQLVGLHLDESEALTGQIQKLVLDHLQTTLADKTPNDVAVRRQIEDAFSKLEYPVQSEAVVFSRPWNGAVITCAGFTLSWLPYPKVNTLAIFVTRDGKTQLATTDSFVPYYTLNYDFLPDQENAASFRFIVHGERPGKSQLRMAAVLYAFDGKSLTRQWQKQDIYDGKLDVVNGKVVMRYLNEDEYVVAVTRSRKPPRYEATYKVTPTTLEVENVKNLPF